MNPFSFLSTALHTFSPNAANCIYRESNRTLIRQSIKVSYRPLRVFEYLSSKAASLNLPFIIPLYVTISFFEKHKINICKNPTPELLTHECRQVLNQSFYPYG